MKTTILTTTVLLIFSLTLKGQIIHVPGDQPTIQTGINAATDGDTVLVDQGTYYENINFLGKAITVSSHYLIEPLDSSHIYNTIIDGSQAINPNKASTVMFVNEEDTTSILCGFTITGGSGYLNTTYNAMHGGGLVIENSGAKIENNIITGNQITVYNIAGGSGIGAIDLEGGSWLVVRNNLISNNKATANGMSAFGGGIASTLNSIIENNIIEYNECENLDEGQGQADGGGIEIEQIIDTPIVAHIKNNIIRHNELSAYQSFGAGMSGLHVSEFYIYENEFYGNTSDSEENGMGGGMYFEDVANIEVVNNLIDQNKVSGYRSYFAGMGINLPQGTILVEGNTITQNRCEAVYGSGGSGLSIYFPLFETKVLNNTFSGNVAQGSEFSYSSFFLWDAFEVEVTVDMNIFEGNEAQYGAGFYSRNSNNLRLTNNIFKENIASSNGGAICLFENYTKGDPYNPQDIFSNNEVPTDRVKMETPHACYANNVFLNNEADLGGAIVTNVDINFPIFFNSIFYGNTANNGKDIYHFGDAPIVVSNSLIDTVLIYGEWNGENNINANPEFVDDSCHLALSSPCLEAGTLSIVVGNTGYHCPDHDIDGDLRPLNSTADIGVDEVLLTGFEEDQDNVSSNIYNIQVQPNPVSNEAIIEFNLPKTSVISLSVYDVTGIKMVTIYHKEFQSGNHKINWNAQDLKNGLYFLKLETNGNTETKKLLIIN